MNPWPTVRLRHARLSDIPKLLVLEEICFDNYYRNERFDRADFRYYLRDPRTIAHVAVAKRSIVGYSLGVQHTGRLRHLARLLSLAVLPEAQRQGIGKQLLKRFVTESRAKGCASILLEVASRNEVASRLFHEAGFRLMKRLPGFYGQGVDGVRLRLDF